MAEALISIIIPTFNSENVVEACLDSIINQTSLPLEIVIIDGLSTDNTIHIVRKYASDHSIIRWISESDKGIYDAMNKGISMAKGDWLYFLGSDDTFYSSTVLMKVKEALEKYTCDFLYGNVTIVGDSSWSKNGTIYEGEFTVEKLFTKNICHQAIFYRQSVFKKLGYFNINYNVCADWDFNHRCFASVKTRYIDLVIGNFFAGGQSTSQTSDQFTNEDFVLNLSDYYKLSYFNKLFRRSAWIFNNRAYKELEMGHMLSSIFFLFFGLYHSQNKMSLIKNFIYKLSANK